MPPTKKSNNVKKGREYDNNSKQRDNKDNNKKAIYRPNHSTKKSSLNELSTIDINIMRISDIEGKVADWCTRFKDFSKEMTRAKEYRLSDLEKLLTFFNSIISAFVRLSINDIKFCNNVHLGQLLLDVFISEIMMIHRISNAVNDKDIIYLFADDLEKQKAVIISLTKDLIDKYKIVIDSKKILQTFMDYDDPKSDYVRYLIQICYTIILRIEVERDRNSLIENPEKVNSFFAHCYCLHPGLGHSRFFYGGVKALTRSFLDAVYFYISAITSKQPYNCHEDLLKLFDESQRYMRYLEKEKHPSNQLRLLALSFIRVIRCIWTNIDLDKFPGYMNAFIKDFNIHMKKWSVDTTLLLPKIIVRMVSILLLTTRTCILDGEESEMHKRVIQKAEFHPLHIRYVSERDLDGHRIFSCLRFLISMLTCMCEAYCNYTSLQNMLLPSISLCFHYFYIMDNSLLCYSTQENSYDIHVKHFIKRIVPFLNHFYDAEQMDFPQNYEECDFSIMCEEYGDIIGNNIVDTLMQTAIISKFYSRKHNEMECKNALRLSYISLASSMLEELGLIKRNNRTNQIRAVYVNLPEESDVEIEESDDESEGEVIKQPYQFKSESESESDSESESESESEPEPEVAMEVDSSSESESESGFKKVKSRRRNRRNNKNNSGNNGNNKNNSGNNGNKNQDQVGQLGENSYYNLRREFELKIDPRFIIILDVPNIAMFHGKNKFSTQGVIIVKNYWESRGYKVSGYIPQHFVEFDHKSFKRPSGVELTLLKQLVDQDIIVRTPARDYDDSYVIQKAVMNQGIIISNDNYDDALKKVKPEMAADFKRFLKTHLLSFTFEKDQFVPKPSMDFGIPKYLEN